MLTKLSSIVLKCSLFGVILFSTFQAESKEVLLEAKASYLNTNGSWTGLYRIETNIQTSKNVYTWASLGYACYQNNLLFDQETFPMNVHLVPFSFGFSYLFKGESWTPYIGIGVNLTNTKCSLETKEESIKSSLWHKGPIIKLGFFLHVAENIFLDLFYDCSFNTPSSLSLIQNLKNRSYSLGAGVGFKF